ncbi:MAG TPA: phosphoribosyl-ATP diphosphatase [Gemmatimonadales bacterium]|nr:phosphoribosyl-ATP diphosphatase [Gemmatimonadales bacterium]
MIVPSIDIIGGRAVQLRRGKELVLDGGDPIARLEEFSVAGEVAVVDLDAALGRGSNAALIQDLVRRAPCRVGGGIRDLDSARRWLDAGAVQVMIGTAATPEFCGALPRERVIAAVDTERGEIVVDGWRTKTGIPVLERVRELAPTVGGFLFTQVEKEGAMGGFDSAAVAAVVRAASGTRVTAAGGITTAVDVAELDRIGADAQVGMALYTGKLSLGDAVAAPLAPSPPDPLSLSGEGGRRVWPTVVCDEAGRTLGLVWSTRESLARAVAERRGIYWSRSRQSIWVKGETSGNSQQLVRVDLDCDRDALRFTVRQAGAGFCHLNRPSCWNSEFDLADLERTLADRMLRPVKGSGTAQLLADSALLAAKLREEADELARAQSSEDVVRETADVFYMALVALVRGGGTLADVRAELARRHGAVSRRPMARKTPAC